eukprot:15469627-Alexandrium_andersonii.AAC.1
MSDIGGQEMPEANTEDIDEETSFLVNLAQERERVGPRMGSESLRLRAAPDPCDAPDLVRA